MAEWPDAAELKQVLNVESGDWDTTLDRVLAAAIRRVKSDVGQWDDDVDAPTDSMAQAALRMAELMAERPQVVAGLGAQSHAAASLSKDPAYLALLVGQRRSFGIG